MPELLGVDDALAYWDRRHGTLGEKRSGGDVGLDESANEIFYAVRLGMLLQVLGDTTQPETPLAVLDAGCGKGWFSRSLARCGHRVVGIDASPAAVERATQLGGARYAVSTLSSFRSPDLFDAVVCIDVLFHLTDDDEWAASVRNLAGLVRLTGRLVVADADLGDRVVLGDYIVHRPLATYEDVLARLGLRHDSTTPYLFRSNPNALHAFTRVR